MPNVAPLLVQADTGPLRTPELRRLLDGYLAALRDADAEPLFDPRALLRFFVHYAVWSFALLLVPFALLTRQRAGPFLRYMRAPFVSLHRGEIPLLKLVTFRPVTRWLVLANMRGTVRRFVGRYEQAAMAAYIDSDDGAAFETAEREIGALNRFGDLIGRRAELKLAIGSILSFTSVFKVAEWAFDFIRKHERPGDFISGGMALAIYGSLFAASAFIRQREILLANAVYSRQLAAAAAVGINPPREFPFDLAIWCSIAAAFTAVVVAVDIYTEMIVWMRWAEAFYGGVTFLFLHAIVRRHRMGQR